MYAFTVLWATTFSLALFCFELMVFQMSDEVVNPYNPDGKKITFYDALNDLKTLSNLDIFEDYAFYGGMPLILSRPTETAKMNYLQSLVSEVYLKDIVERKKIKREDVLASILDLLSMIKESRGDCKCANQRVRKRNAIYSGSVKI